MENTKLIRFSLVDDDSSSIDIICASLIEAFKSHGYQAIVRKYTSPKTFLSDFQTNTPDILFSDIEMPEMDGIEMIKEIKADKRPTIIFISNREDRVFDALSLHPFGFIRKKNFLVDVNNVISSYFFTIVNSNSYSLFIKNEEGEKISLEIDNIVYIESDGKEQTIHLFNVDTPIKANTTMNHLDETLSQYDFIRCHKAYIVNSMYIYSILNDEIKLKTGESVFLSRRKAKEVKEKYLNYIQSKGKFVY